MSWDRVWTAQNITRLLVGDLANGSPGGLLLTVIMGVIAIVGGTIVGTILCLMRTSNKPLLSTPALIVIQGLRNVPLLIVIFWFYFATPYFGVPLSRFASVTIALVLFTAAYIAEILRGGMRSVAGGTIEGGRAIGLNAVQIYVYIIIPIAFYSMIPALTNRYITAVKNTSLAYLIGFSELTEIGREINARIYTAPIEIYTTILVMYFVVNRILSSAMRRLESRRLFNRLFIKI